MDITSSNFLTHFPQILNAYNKCSIIAVDGEFSGVNFDEDLALETYRGILPEEQLKPLQDLWDKPGKESAYQKLRWIVRRYTLLQLGITFAWPAKDEKDHPILKTETYSFLISPFLDGQILDRVKLETVFKRVVSMNINSVQFLKRSGFDFGSLVENGLQYLTHTEEAELRSYLNIRFFRRPPDKKDENENHKTKDLQGREARERDKIRTIIENRVAARRNPRGLSITIHPPEDMDITAWKTLVQHVVDQGFPRFWIPHGQPGPGVFIKFVELECTHDDDLARKHNIEADIRKAIGVRNVLDMLIGSDIRTRIQPQDIAKTQLAAERRENEEPIDIEHPELKARTEAIQEAVDTHGQSKQQPILIGHNLGWDLPFMINTLFEPLPDTLPEFLPRVDGLFPRILDTRIILDKFMPGLEKASLPQIVARLKDRSVEPRCQSESGLGYGDDDGKAHDAAYDSFLTVEAFARLGQDLVLEKCFAGTTAFPSQAEINEEIVDWRSPIWDPFRGQFKILGELVR